MDRSVGGEPPPPPDLSDYPSLNPRASHLPAAAAPLPAGAPIVDAPADLSTGRGSCAPTADAGSGDVKGAWRGERTLAQLLSRSLQPAAIPVRVHAPAATDLGKPAAFFSHEEVQVSCNPLDYVLMVKTPLGRPPFQIIRGHLSQRFKLEKDFILCPYDGRHLLLRMGSREDYLKLLLKGTTYVDGKPFHFQKWSMDFSVAADCPLVPVWLEMPRLPANFFLEPMLRSIAGSIGQVLQIAQCTSNLTMAHAAVVCVQLDVSQPLPDCVWIGIGAGGFWQPVVYPNPPQFCKSCNRLGHLAPNCRQAATPGAPQHKGTKVASDKGIQMPPHDAVGSERLKKQPPVNVKWRPTVAQPAPARRIPPVEQGTNSAQKVFDVMSQQELPSGSRAPTVQAQAQGVYLTPLKRPQQKSTLGTSAKGSDPAASSGGESSALPDLQQMRSKPSHAQFAAPQVLDEMTCSLEQLSLQAKDPDPSVGSLGGPSTQLNAAAPAWSPSLQERADVEMVDDPPTLQPAVSRDQILKSARAKEPESSPHKSLDAGSAPAALPWTPSVHERGDIDLPEEFPSLLPATRSEQTRSSARGKKPVQLLQQPPDDGFISLPITHDIMSFPGIPELPDDVPPRIHMRGRPPPSVSQGGGPAQQVDMLPQAETLPSPEAGQKIMSPHTPALAPLSSPHQATAAGAAAAGPSRISFSTALKRRVRASDTRRTERALEESDPEEGLSTSDSSEEDHLPPPPPPLVSDWIQAAAPGSLIVGLPASQKVAEMPKIPAKEGGEPKLPPRQTRQTLRRGFL